MKPMLYRCLHLFEISVSGCLPRRLQELREAMGLSNVRHGW